MLKAQVVIELIPAPYRLGTAKEITHITINDVVASLEHGDVKLWLVPPEARAQHPGFAIGDFFRNDHLAGNLAKLEVHQLVTVKGGFFP